MALDKKIDSFHSTETINCSGKTYHYHSIAKAEENGLPSTAQLPKSLRVLLENLLRKESSSGAVKKDDILAICEWIKNKKSSAEIAYHPARVLMQDFTGVPAVVDLAAMRDAMIKLGSDAEKINPLNPVDLVIDHSVMVDHNSSEDAESKNIKREFERNQERYEFLRWGQSAFKNFRVVPPGTGICHQVNLEHLAKVVWSSEEDGKNWAYPDTLVGTDSHTTMINGLSVLGWGVGGIEAEAAMLGQPVSMLIPEVIGFELKGQLPAGSTATDLVLTVVEMLRKKGVVGKFVEFYGEGLKNLSLADRATLANMAPEYGATCGFFPIDEETLKYLRLSGRDEEQIELVEKYAKAQLLWNDDKCDISFTDTLSLDINNVKSSIAGPKRPQDRIELSQGAEKFYQLLKEWELPESKECPVKDSNFVADHGHVAIAAITSCTNTSNPTVMMAAGLLAKKAAALGLKCKEWVKCSLAPGSQVVSDYLSQSGLQNSLDELGFNVVGYGCTTCIGNSGPIDQNLAETAKNNELVLCSVLSGNRNFEGRISPDIQANYLASPPLVVAYAIAGSLKIDVQNDALGKDKEGNDVYLKDIWPNESEVQEIVSKTLNAQMFKDRYKDVFKGPEAWSKIESFDSQTYPWKEDSTYIRHAPFFEGMQKEESPATDVKSAHILALLADSVTTDHISPAGSIKHDGPAGEYLKKAGVDVRDFNSFGSRRGNHEVMMRGTFANIRIKNQMLDDVEGGYTRHVPSNKEMSIYDAAMEYAKSNTPLVVFAGKEYGTGSSRDWAAKGTRLLGVRAVIAESYERIHRSNLIGMGVLPLEFENKQSWKSLGLNGNEKVSIQDINSVQAGSKLQVNIEKENGEQVSCSVLCRIDTDNELEYYKNEGILQFVIRKLLS